MTIRISLLLSIALVAACGTDRVEVRTATDGSERGALTAAVDRFVAAGRTPEAYAELAGTVTPLRSGATQTLADEAGLMLDALALAPIEQTRARTLDDSLDALVLTVLPTLLAPATLEPRPAELPHEYLERLCSGPLADACEHVAPRWRAHAVYALAIQRSARRARHAIDRCATCAHDPAWHAAGLAWDELERSTLEWAHDISSRAPAAPAPPAVVALRT